MFAFLTPVLSFFTGIWGKLATYAAIGALILALLGGLYWSITSSAAKNQALTDQVAQLKQTVADQQRFQQQTEQLQKDGDAQSNALQEQIAKLQANADAINKVLTSPKFTKSDRASSDLLKQTITEIQKLNN